MAHCKLYSYPKERSEDDNVRIVEVAFEREPSDYFFKNQE